MYESAVWHTTINTGVNMSDRNVSKTNKDGHDPLQVTIGPITRARAKRFKEALAKLIQEVQLKEDSKLTINEEQKLVHIIKAIINES